VDSHVYDTLILSDLHLGADMSRARDALARSDGKPGIGVLSERRHLAD